MTQRDDDAVMIEFCGRLSAVELVNEFLWEKLLSQGTAEAASALLKELRDRARTLSVPTTAHPEMVDRLGMDIAVATRKGVERFCERLAPAEH